MLDSNSRKRFQTSIDNSDVRPPDDKTRSNSTRVLLSSEMDSNLVLVIVSCPDKCYLLSSVRIETNHLNVTNSQHNI